MCILGAYKWALSVSPRLIKHEPHIKVARGCARQDRSEQRVFTVIKVNSGQPLGIALLLRHVAAALSSRALWTQALGEQPANPLVFQRGEKKTRKSKLACRPPPPYTPPTPRPPLLCWCPTLNLWMINLPTEAVRRKIPRLEDPHVSSMTHPVCVARASASDLYTHNSRSGNTCAFTIFIPVHLSIVRVWSHFFFFFTFKREKPADLYIKGGS